jgi:hypothetical protein
VSNVQNWLSEKGCIARAETDYIDQASDIITLEDATSDSALDGVALMIERVLMRLPGMMSSVSSALHLKLQLLTMI